MNDAAQQALSPQDDQSVQPVVQQLTQEPSQPSTHIQDIGADAQVLQSVVQTAIQHDPLNPPNAGPSGTGAGSKEKVGASLDALAAEIPGAQSVEQEKTPEISPELESWMEKVGNHEIQPPQEIVVADDTATNLTGNYAAQPVVMLPATEETIQKGMKHPVTDSVRWLAAWCFKMIKKFHGAVIYRHSE